MMFPRIARSSTASLLFSKQSVQWLRHGNNSKNGAAIATSLYEFVGSSRDMSRTPSKHSFSTELSVKNPDMFCRQCEQTREQFACTTIGVCGKTAEVAAAQDTLIEVVKCVSAWANAARRDGDISDSELHAIGVWTLQASFSTLTNVNFSDSRITEYIQQGLAHVQTLKASINDAAKHPTAAQLPMSLDTSSTHIDFETFGHDVASIPNRLLTQFNDNADAMSLAETATYGLKGICAYAAHVQAMGDVSPSVIQGVQECFEVCGTETTDIDALLANVLKVGELAATVLGMLDEAHASTFGAMEPTQVKTTAVEGKAILVSGHDMVDLYHLLQQTENTGINVYTHGEMLPAHAYPKLKAFKHLVGNYGTAWQNQKFEFATFPGPIVMTTNCIIEPRKLYKGRIYTMNEVGVDNVQHIDSKRDFSAVIAQAKEMKGFPRTIEPEQFVTTGFNHRVVLPLAGDVIEAAKSGKLSRIFLIGGCDGSQWERSYYTELAEETPDNSLILTLGCAKNRIIYSEKLKDAMIPGTNLPRVLDMGQCNDSYSAVVVASELAKALGCGINDLPLSLAISHLEQKAAAVLLCLLHLNVKNIRLGPSLPSYLSPNVLKVLSDKYNVMQVGDPKTDLANMMEGK